MRTKHDYYELQAELEKIERSHGNLYLTDPCVDMEDAGLKETDEGFWGAMYASMCNSAGLRAEELGLDINKLLGRTIY